jgi:hypothetical protein
MKQFYNSKLRIPIFGLWIVLFCWVCGSQGTSSVLSGLELLGSAKGLALMLKADAPFLIKMEQKASAKNPGQTLLAVHCTNVIYGLEEFEFTSFPPASPVKRISVSESPVGNTIDMLFTFSQTIDDPVASKQKENRWTILLSRGFAGDFSWTAAPREKPNTENRERKIGRAQTGMSRLKDVSVLHRDRVKQLVFQFDRPTTMRLKRGQDKIMVLFVNAANGLSAGVFSPPGEPPTTIELKQVAHGGTMWLCATVSMGKESLTGALMQAFGDRLVIYCVTDSLPGLSLWSAARGQDMSYNFISIPRFTVDYDGMRKKALTDIIGDVAMENTFTIREETPKDAAMERLLVRAVAPEEKESVMAPPPAQKVLAVVRLIVTKDNVNLRSSPFAGNNVIAKVPIGTIASQTEKKKEWVKIALEDKTGWVLSAMVADSSKASQSVVAAIDKIYQQRLAREKAAEENAARDKAVLEKVDRDRLANEQFALERETQKKVALEAQVAARDSAVRYAAAIQESLQTLKNIRAKKLVEYHVYGRDPFLPLSRDADSPVPEVEDLRLVGILYDAGDRIALFEDGRSKAYALRENDPVQNGYLLRVQPDKVLFLINELGISRTYALKLSKEKEQ